MTDRETAKAIAHLKSGKQLGFGSLSSFTESMIDAGLVEIEFGKFHRSQRRAYFAHLSAKGYDFVEEHA